MGAPRAAALLIGLGLLGLGADGAGAMESSVEDGSAAVVAAEPSGAPTPSDAADLRPAEDPSASGEPEKTVVIEGLAPSGAGAAASEAQGAAIMPPDIAPPDLPSVAVSVPSPDPIARAIENLLTNASPLHPRLGQKDREALVAFYALGGFKPIWTKDRAWADQARSVIARLRAAGEDALDPAAYPVSALGAGGRGDAPEGLAEADLKLSASAVLYAHDARGARIEPWRLS